MRIAFGDCQEYVKIIIKSTWKQLSGKSRVHGEDYLDRKEIKLLQVGNHVLKSTWWAITEEDSCLFFSKFFCVTDKSHIKTEKWHTLKDPAKYLSTECFPLVKDKMYTNDSFRDTKFGPLGLGLLYCDNSCMHPWTRKDILFEFATKYKIKELDEENMGNM